MDDFSAPNMRERVDGLMAAPKTIAGEPEWNVTDYEGQYRWLAATSINGSLTNLNLIVDAYPRISSLKFTIMFVYQVSVCRLDYGEVERHSNHKVKGIRTPYGIENGWIYGHHNHSWEHNRVLATHSSLPKLLEFACTIPGNVRGFPSAFRWFCGEGNVAVPEILMPNLPVKDTIV